MREAAERRSHALLVEAAAADAQCLMATRKRAVVARREGIVAAEREREEMKAASAAQTRLEADVRLIAQAKIRTHVESTEAERARQLAESQRDATAAMAKQAAEERVRIAAYVAVQAAAEQRARADSEAVAAARERIAAERAMREAGVQRRSAHTEAMQIALKCKESEEQLVALNGERIRADEQHLELTARLVDEQQNLIEVANGRAQTAADAVGALSERIEAEREAALSEKQRLAAERELAKRERQITDLNIESGLRAGERAKSLAARLRRSIMRPLLAFAAGGCMVVTILGFLWAVELAGAQGSSAQGVLRTAQAAAPLVAGLHSGVDSLSLNLSQGLAEN